jgi:hypothetical protein
VQSQFDVVVRERTNDEHRFNTFDGTLSSGAVPPADRRDPQAMADQANAALSQAKRASSDFAPQASELLP